MPEFEKQSRFYLKKKLFIIIPITFVIGLIIIILVQPWNTTPNAFFGIELNKPLPDSVKKVSAPEETEGFLVDPPEKNEMLDNYVVLLKNDLVTCISAQTNQDTAKRFSRLVEAIENKFGKPSTAVDGTKFKFDMKSATWIFDKVSYPQYKKSKKEIKIEFLIPEYVNVTLCDYSIWSHSENKDIGDADIPNSGNGIGK